MSRPEAREVALALRHLLDELHPHSPSATVFHFDGQPHTPAVVQMLAQYRRLNHRERNDFWVGINEFNVGLCYCSWGQFEAARRYLQKAELRWKMGNRPVYVALAQFALARVLQLAMEFEAALRILDRADAAVDRLLDERPANGAQSLPAPPALLKRVKRNVVDAQRENHRQIAALWDHSTPAEGADWSATRRNRRAGYDTYPDGVPAPRIQVVEPGARAPASPRRRNEAPPDVEGSAHWYEITRRSGRFLPQLRLGDRLHVAALSGEDAPLRRNLLLIVDEWRLQGQVQVIEISGQGTRALTVAQLVRETEDGRLAIIAHDQRRPLTCRRRNVVGIVDGLWRGLQGIG